MRILHVVPSFGLGGMEKVICAFINSTSSCHIHKILSLDRRTEASNWIKDKKIQFVAFEKPNERAQFFRTLHRVLQTIKPDLLMTYNWGATDAIWLGRIAGIRHVIHSEHGFNVDEGNATYWKRDVVRCLLYRLASKVIVVSRELQTLLQRKYLLGGPHLLRIPNGIDASHYSPDPMERERMRRNLGFEDSDIVVGFSGRLDLIKNLGLLVDVFASCGQEHPNLRLLMVGDGPEKVHLETLCQKRSIRDRVVFAGQQENVLSYLRSMDIFLLTSLREQMPLTVLEAMAVGIPVVATKVGEIPHIVDDGINGYVVDLEAPVEAFVGSLSELLSPARREDMRTRARQKIVDHFQEQAMVQEYKTIIEHLSDPSRDCLDTVAG
jgi:glycosyltransferase involved in cell wall biosynthesis